jgi:two-component system cell cycle sensor histidine kinase/response regulator CckA
MAESTERPAEARWIGFLPVAVFLVSSALMLLLWQVLAAAQRRFVEELFQANAGRVISKTSERLEAYHQILRGAVGLFASSEEVTRAEFRRYVEKLQLGVAYRGIQGVGFSIWIPPDRLEEQVRKVRAEGFPDFSVRPPGPRQAYTSVIYVEPFSGRNVRALGYDGLAEPTRRSAMEHARDRGEPATSAKVRLVQEDEADVQPGVLTFFPIYENGPPPTTEASRRAAFVGWVYTPLRMRDLMEGILGTEPGDIRLEIFDGSEIGAEHLLHDSLGGAATTESALFSLTVPLQVNQRTWTLRFSAGDSFLAEPRRRNRLGAAAGMTVVVLLLTGLSAALAASRRSRLRAIGLARSLQESEARHRIVLERAPVGIFTVGPDNHFLTVNSRCCEITGWSAEELRGMTRDDVTHPEDRDMGKEIARQIRSGERVAGTIARRGIRKDGSVFWCEATLSREDAGSGMARNLVGVLDDVTARHEAEEKFRLIAERSMAGIFIIQDGRIVYANQAVSELAGISVADLTGMTSDEARTHIFPEDLPVVRRDAIKAVAPVAGTTVLVTYRVVRPDGSVRRVEQLARPIQHQGAPAMLVTLLDVTERVKAEEEARRAQRLESLGLVAGGIAHDFNNLLTAVFGQVEMARGHLDPEAPAARELDVALSALARSRDLTRQLLTFSTGGAPARKVLSVGKLLEDAVKLGLGGSSLRARLELSPDLPPVEADEGQMSQILNNLLVNARQATPGAGEVLIRAGKRHLASGEAPPLPAGAYVQISIQDTGHGIPERLLAKVFDPFFTTRPTGTGLGLATSYSMARRHGGLLSIASRVGEGTTLTLLLPAVPGNVAGREVVAEPPAAPLKPAAARRFRILLMDDEPLVLKVGAKQLRKLGMEVETAVTGEEAVEMYRRRLADGDPHDVVILDLTVPGGMGGAAALERLREIDPGVVAIACSGYFEEGVMADPGKFGFAGVLGKPYLTADLEQVLAAVTAQQSK